MKTDKIYQTEEGEIRMYVCQHCGHGWFELVDADEYPEYCPGCGCDLRPQRIVHTLAILADRYMTEASSVAYTNEKRSAILKGKAAAVNECIELIEDEFDIETD